jgi:hypothetical protein
MERRERALASRRAGAARRDSVIVRKWHNWLARRARRMRKRDYAMGWRGPRFVLERVAAARRLSCSVAAAQMCPQIDSEL